MKIYTKTGDSGETGLFGGARVSKDDLRIEAYGSVDETNAFLGVARACALPADLDAVLARIQADLFTIGAILATPEEALAKQKSPPVITGDDVQFLEATIDQLELGLEPLRQFILPGGSPGASALHTARTVSRRAERRVVTLGKLGPIPSTVLVYLNRLSDLLFVMARAANRRLGVPDVPWQR